MPPYKAVIDTNVLVSALLTPGRNAARILSMVRDKTLVPCYIAGIMEEYREVLSRDKFNLPEAEVDVLLTGISRRGAGVGGAGPAAHPRQKTNSAVLRA